VFDAPVALTPLRRIPGAAQFMFD